jgi:hypothetical protein
MNLMATANHPRVLPALIGIDVAVVATAGMVEAILGLAIPIRTAGRAGAEPHRSTAAGDVSRICMLP